jgi:spermidine/putrescine transport system permease protein
MSTAPSLFGRVERLVYNHGRKLGVVAVIAGLLYLWLPIFVLGFMSFAERQVLTFPPQSYTVDWYFTFLQNDQATSAVMTTIRVSLVATPLAVFVSTLIAYAIDRYTFVGKQALQLASILPIVVPLIVVGVAMAIFFGSVGIASGYWAVVFAHVVRIIPFAVLIIVPTLLAFDRTLEEASHDLGADELKTFVQITLPNVFPGIVAATLLAFTISFNEFVYTYFVKDTTTTTLPTYLWDTLRQNATPEVNVISVIFILVAISLVLLAIAFTHVERIAQTE